MKKPLLICLGMFWLVSSSFAEIPTKDRQDTLRQLLKNDCGACHGLTLKGGMGPALLPENLLGKTDAYLLETVLKGRKGTAMPPWQPFMSRAEALWLLGILRKP